jgi:hypothetical protein
VLSAQSISLFAFQRGRRCGAVHTNNSLTRPAAAGIVTNVTVFTLGAKSRNAAINLNIYDETHDIFIGVSPMIKGN